MIGYYVPETDRALTSIERGRLGVSIAETEEFTARVLLAAELEKRDCEWARTAYRVTHSYTSCPPPDGEGYTHVDSSLRFLFPRVTTPANKKRRHWWLPWRKGGGRG